MPLPFFVAAAAVAETCALDFGRVLVPPLFDLRPSSPEALSVSAEILRRSPGAAHPARTRNKRLSAGRALAKFAEMDGKSPRDKR